MINLLPNDTKTQIAAARANRLLLRYNIILLISVGFLIAAIVFVQFYLQNTKVAAEEAIEFNRSKASDYAEIEGKATAFRQSLTNAKQILDNDATYTKVILDIARVLPRGVVLDTLALDSTTFGVPTTMTANVRDYQTVLLLKEALQNSSIFSNVSLQSISSGSDGEYPLSATLSVTIDKDAAK